MYWGQAPSQSAFKRFRVGRQGEEAWQAASLAEHAAQRLRSVQRLLPRPACVLAGVGCGAAIAHELGVQLQTAGIEVFHD